MSMTCVIVVNSLKCHANVKELTASCNHLKLDIHSYRTHDNYAVKTTNDSFSINWDITSHAIDVGATDLIQ